MITEIVATALGTLALLVAIVVAPPIARCRDGFYVEGVRPSGKSTCREIPPPGCGEPKWTPPCPEPRTMPIRIYCTGGTVPLVLDDGETIGCQRR